MKKTTVEKMKIRDVIGKINSVEHPKLDAKKKLSIKQSLLAQLKSKNQERVPATLYALLKLIKGVSEGQSFPRKQSAAVKQRVFAALDFTPQRSFILGRFFSAGRVFVSTMLLVSMFFGFLAFVNVDQGVVRAETFTTLDSFEGEVFVEREGVKLDPVEGMRIYEDDRISTGKKSRAVIKYFDDSISRLSESSELFVDELFKPTDKYVDSYVKVMLMNGAVWSKVVTLVGDQSSFVVKANDISASAKKAAFNVKIKDEEVEVEVFNRSVDVRNKGKTDTVISGQKAVVKKDIEQVELQQITDEEKEVAWVQDNLHEDQEHMLEVEERLLAAKVDSMGLEVNSEAGLKDSLKDNIVVFLTFDDVEKQKKQLALAEKKFIAAQSRLKEGGLDQREMAEVQSILKSFSAEVKQFYGVTKEVSYSDPAYSAELKRFIDDKVLEHKKDLSVVLKDSSLYEAKKVVDDLSLLVANQDSEIVEDKIEYLADKLSEVEDLSVRGDEEVAEEVITEYKKEVGEIMTAIGSLNETTDVKNKLIDDVESVQKYYAVVVNDDNSGTVDNLDEDGDEHSVQDSDEEDENGGADEESREESEEDEGVLIEEEDGEEDDEIEEDKEALIEEELLLEFGEKLVEEVNLQELRGRVENSKFEKYGVQVVEGQKALPPGLEF